MPTPGPSFYGPLPSFKGSEVWAPLIFIGWNKGLWIQGP